MSDKIYNAIVTDIGNSLLLHTMLEGTKINLTTLVVGDGDGSYYEPTPEMTSLKKQTWRGPVNRVKVNDESPNMLDVIAVIPANVGGFTIREMAILTDKDEMFAICNTPDTEKVIITTGAAGEIELQMHIELSNTDAVTSLVDPNIIVATKKDVEELAKDLAAAKAFGFTGTLPNKEWTGTSAPYTKNITVNGILAEAKPPIVDVELSAAWASLQQEEAAWGNIKRISYGNNTLTFYADEIPPVNLNFKGVQVK